MQTSVDLACFDGEYNFRLPMAGIIAIEQKCNAGIGEIYARTLAGRYEGEGLDFGVDLEARYRYSDLIEVVRQGLIGGAAGFVDGKHIKVDSLLANHLIAVYISSDRDNPIEQAWKLAAAILRRCIYGYEPAQKEAEKKTEQETGLASPTEARSSETGS